MTSSEPENLAPTLLAMPDIVMDEILGYCCYLEFQSLRKTCHQLRDTIANDKMDPRFKSIDVNIHSGYFRTNSIILTLHFYDDHPSVDLNYITDQRGCWIEKKVHSLPGKRVKFLENQDFRHVFFRDFERFAEALKSPKTKLHQFSLKMDRGDYGFLQKLQDSTVENLKIENLSLLVNNFSDAFNFLSFLSLEHLKKLKIESGHDVELHLDETDFLSNLNHLKELQLQGFLVEDPRKILKLPCSRMRVRTLSADVLEDIRRTCCTSPTFISCRLHYDYMAPNIFEVLGVPTLEGRILEMFVRSWVWKTLNPTRILQIESHRDFFLFTIVGSQGIGGDIVVNG